MEAPRSSVRQSGTAQDSKSSLSAFKAHDICHSHSACNRSIPPPRSSYSVRYLYVLASHSPQFLRELFLGGGGWGRGVSGGVILFLASLVPRDLQRREHQQRFVRDVVI